MTECLEAVPAQNFTSFNCGQSVVYLVSADHLRFVSSAAVAEAIARLIADLDLQLVKVRCYEVGKLLGGSSVNDYLCLTLLIAGKDNGTAVFDYACFLTGDLFNSIAEDLSMVEQIEVMTDTTGSLIMFVQSSRPPSPASSTIISHFLTA